VTGQPMAFIAVARTEGPGSVELWAFDLAQQQLRWRQRATIRSRVAVADAVVVHAERNGSLVALDLITGSVKWQRKLGGKQARVGYAAGGDTVAEVLQATGGTGADAKEATVVGYDAISGSRRWSTNVAGPVGAPEVWGRLVALPRQSQWVTLIDGRTGKIAAEILSREQAASFVRGLPEGLFFGSRGVFAAGAGTALATAGSGLYLEAEVPDFVRPVYHHDMYRAAETEYSAIDRNRLLWRVDTQGTAPTFLANQVVVHNFRFFFAIDAKSGELRWAFNQPRTDAISSVHTGSSIVFVTADGVVRALDADSGQLTYEAGLPGAGSISIVGATFDADGFAPQGAPHGGPPVLARALGSIVWDPDRRFSDVRLFALEELAKQEGPDVTRELLRALDGDAFIPAPVEKRALELLVQRQDRSLLDVYKESLAVHPDYAEGRGPKRIEFFARAIAQLGATDAVPLLVDHLRLPDTDIDAITAIASAVLALEAKGSVEPFADFLLQYRADQAFAAAPTPLLAACDVLRALGGPKEQALLLFVAEAPHTLEAVSTHIQRTLEPTSSIVDRPN